MMLCTYFRRVRPIQRTRRAVSLRPAGTSRSLRRLRTNEPEKSHFVVLTLLGDKMNLTVRLGKQFPVSSPCLPRQLGAGQQGRYTNGTLIKQYT